METPDALGRKIYRAIPAIMGELEAVGRERRNQAQNFNYRGIDDLYNALQPLMAKHGVFTAPMVLEERRVDKPTKSGGMQTHVVLKVQYRFYADDGSFFDAVLIGEGMDSGDKASNKAESVAHKYALTQVFAVRTEDQVDPDGTTPEPTAPPKKPVDTKPNPKLTLTPPAKNQSPDMASEPQIKRMWALSKEAGYAQPQLKELIYSLFGDAVLDDKGVDVTTKKITKSMMIELHKVLEREAKKPKK